MIRIALPSLLLLSIVGCAALPPPYAGPAPSGPGMCDAVRVGWAIGRAPTPDVVERARVESYSAVARVIEPGMSVTMDFRADRLNIDLNDRRAIVGLRCG